MDIQGVTNEKYSSCFTMQPIPDEQLKETLSGLKNDRLSYDQLMFGDESKNIPKQANYIVGYKILQSYLKQHPQEKVEDWTTLDTNKIIQNSDYADLINK
ncbi:DUF2268 domain-containing putative Zn-dependent protease [Peribacillus kribbensis]|uniref:DUF2268 domain-containing putative Zn-dependent protease n=1 Tax=Peribacillus kribbensis TaxID=356658 RepID=UPI0003FF48A7|nr:DUF2268 domain-containing putative Zn-dependent protease [Peribacillus kribbensis]